LDALTISEEVENIRNDRRSKKKYSAQDYLLSTRFEEHYEMVLKLISTFVGKIGSALAPEQLRDLLLVVTELKIAKFHYVGWNECIGSFL
jgi:hypothetical protein